MCCSTLCKLLHLLPRLVPASLTNKSSPILNPQIRVDMISNVSSAFQKKKNDILWRAFFLRHNLISYLIWRSNMSGRTPWKSNAVAFPWQSSDLTLNRHPKNIFTDCYLMVAFDMWCAMYIKQCNIRGYMRLMLPAWNLCAFWDVARKVFRKASTRSKTVKTAAGLLLLRS